jgi:uncharacterized damage-inducible protein DinB
MHTTDAIRIALTLSYEWNRMLAEDLRSAPLAFPTSNGGNHATWVVGHAATSQAGLRSFITGEPSPRASWEATLGGGTTPVADASAYPSYETLMDAWKAEYEKTLALLAEQTDASLDARPKALPDSLKDHPSFRSVGHVLMLIAMHEMSHRAQLADVRRALGRGVLAF